MAARKIVSSSLILFAITLLPVPPTLFAQEHLEPEPGLLSVRDSTYQQKLRYVLTEGYQPNVILTVLILGPVSTETLVGIRDTSDGPEAFSFQAKTSIWDTEMLRLFDAGQITQFDMEGRIIPKEKSQAFRDLLKRTPAEYSSIQTDRTTKTIPSPVADQIAGYHGAGVPVTVD